MIFLIELVQRLRLLQLLKKAQLWFILRGEIQIQDALYIILYEC